MAYNQKEFKLALPSVEEGKALAKVFKKPLNGLITLIGCAAPVITPSAIEIGKQKNLLDASTRAVTDLGFLVINAPTEGEAQVGDVVYLKANHSGFEVTKILTSNKLLDGFSDIVLEGLKNTETGKFAEGSTLRELCYQKFAVVLMHPMNLACIIDTNEQ